MAASFFFYDLETTGIRTHDCRIMQFAGQRTNMDLEPVGEPVNILIKISPDILPEPEAVLLTGITPQATIQDGVTEVDFLKVFTEEVATPDTIFVGYNTVRFDDEFMRCLHYRNFYDPYEWQWRDGRSRWDLLDVVRMTRALRPEGIQWPVTDEGVPTNRLELVSSLNGLDHAQAHDALSDVGATIAVAKLIRDKQPKLFDWLLQLRGKKQVKEFLAANQTFVYTSGKYDNDTEKTAVVERLTLGDDQQGALVYDLRHDPQQFAALSTEELAERWQYNRDPQAPARLPVKTIKYNRCPAICPVGLIKDDTVQARLGITLQQVEKNRAALAALPELRQKILLARQLMDAQRGDNLPAAAAPQAELRMYDGFADDHDKQLSSVVRAADPSEITSDNLNFHDNRFNEMLPRYKARNFPEALSAEERTAWDDYRNRLLFEGGDNSLLGKYFQQLGTCAEDKKYADKQFLLEELQLYGQSLMPAYADDDSAEA